MSSTRSEIKNSSEKRKKTKKFKWKEERTVGRTLLTGKCEKWQTASKVFRISLYGPLQSSRGAFHLFLWRGRDEGRRFASQFLIATFRTKGKIWAADAAAGAAHKRNMLMLILIFSVTWRSLWVCHHCLCCCLSNLSTVNTLNPNIEGSVSPKDQGISAHASVSSLQATSNFTWQNKFHKVLCFFFFFCDLSCYLFAVCSGFVVAMCVSKWVCLGVFSLYWLATI